LWFDYQAGEKSSFLFSKASRPDLAPTQSHTQWEQGTLPTGVNLPMCDDDPPPHNNCGVGPTLKYISSASIRNLFQSFNDTCKVKTLAEICNDVIPFYYSDKNTRGKNKWNPISFLKKAITCRRPTSKNVPLQSESGTFTLVQCQHFIYPQ
jgi:hypothetical protein